MYNFIPNYNNKKQPVRIIVMRAVRTIATYWPQVSSSIMHYELIDNRKKYRWIYRKIDRINIDIHTIYIHADG